MQSTFLLGKQLQDVWIINASQKLGDFVGGRSEEGVELGIFGVIEWLIDLGHICNKNYAHIFVNAFVIFAQK